MRSRLGGAALAALTAVLLAPGEARAGCSHGQEARPIGPDRLSLLEDSGALVEEVDGVGTSPDRAGGRRGGCSGPSCSGKSGLPSVPASLLSPRFVQWAAWSVPPASPGRCGSPGVRDGCPMWTNPSSDAVFHPPRPSCVR
ncbi:hypothetical protein OJF2_75460 [Aquisphaera giovannonii]|uniref:Uncharacterized protein n=1 Tax=Aquisphaera giovannonii TaxID=406548 RepID=A0A5B9WE62_9BACT|nr:hypothetical protein [Aquisphaera giovannonii]QEH38936.1 hypothetical protein OJF2_75460 [Aquisphaera giovannonii]